MNEKLILTATLTTFFVASIFLTLTLARQFDSAQYWSIAFVAPHTEGDYRFTITNHTPSTAFTYTLYDTTGTETESQHVTVAPNATQTITPQHYLQNAPLTITVTHDGTTHILRK